MKDQIISFPTAKLAKEIGFKEKTHHYYFFYEPKEYKKLYPEKVGTAELESNSKCLVKYSPGRRCETIEYEEAWVDLDDLLKDVNEYPARDVMFQAPTQSLLQKYLRDEFDIHIGIDMKRHFKSNQWVYHISKDDFVFNDIIRLCYASYEEALEEGLIYALNLIRTSQP